MKNTNESHFCVNISLLYIIAQPFKKASYIAPTWCFLCKICLCFKELQTNKSILISYTFLFIASMMECKKYLLCPGLHFMIDSRCAGTK